MSDDKNSLASQFWRALIYLAIIALMSWLLSPYFHNLILAAIVSSIFIKFKPRFPAKLTRHKNIYAALGTFTSLLVMVIPILLLLILLGLEAYYLVDFIQDMFERNDPNFLTEHLVKLEKWINMRLQRFGTNVQFSALQKEALNHLQNFGSLLYNNSLKLLRRALSNSNTHQLG